MQKILIKYLSSLYHTNHINQDYILIMMVTHTLLIFSAKQISTKRNLTFENGHKFNQPKRLKKCTTLSFQRLAN